MSRDQRPKCHREDMREEDREDWAKDFSEILLSWSPRISEKDWKGLNRFYPSQREPVGLGWYYTF